MYIRTTQTRSSETGERYITHRLVESRRIGKSVRQVTLLNLGRHFSFPQDQWRELCDRIGQLLCGQDAMFEVPEGMERVAQHCVARLIAEGVMLPPDTRSDKADSATDTDRADGTAKPDVTEQAATAFASDVPVHAEVVVDSLELLQPRSIGVEHVGLAAMRELGFDSLLASLGVNGVMRTAIVGSVIARMAAPGSELAAHRWLTTMSGLGDLLNVDMAALPLSRLYRASDVLMKHHDAIESALFSRIESLFDLEESVTLYDLTNTYFEGDGAANGKAKRGHSKEKRTDCPLVTLGVVCDGSGFIRRSKVFAGNAVECRTLQEMLDGLGAPKSALVIMDRGIATEANIVWLTDNGYRYLVVSRERDRHFDEAAAIECVGASGQSVRLVREVAEDGQEVRLYCHSPLRELKEMGIVERFCARLERGLTQLAEGLRKPRGDKHPDRIHARIGRLKASCRGAGQYYAIHLDLDASGQKAKALHWKQAAKPGSMLESPGVYCLRSNELSWDAERLWHTYMTLTDLESVFRSLKGELGLRPIFHSKEDRTDGHLFISVLAYQCVQWIRRRLKEHGILMSWTKLREVFSVQRRVTARFTQRDGRTLHVRKATRPEPDLKKLYAALGLNPMPGGIRKLVI